MPVNDGDTGAVSPRAAVPKVPAAPPPFKFIEPVGPGEEERTLEKKRRMDKGDEDDERKLEDSGTKGRKMPKARAKGRLKIKRSFKIYDARDEESEEDKGTKEEDEKGKKKKEDEEKQKKEDNEKQKGEDENRRN